VRAENCRDNKKGRSFGGEKYFKASKGIFLLKMPFVRINIHLPIGLRFMWRAPGITTSICRGISR
jgi:hypothetical protein